MTATISEDYNSRPFSLGRQAGRELVFTVRGTEDEEEVQALLLATAPGAYLGRELESVEAEPLGGGIWKAHARYVRFEDDSEYTFDTGGATTKITQSLETVAVYAPGGLPDPPDFQGAIGVSEDHVEGCDVTTPTFNFTETHKFADSAVDAAYKMTLFRLTGKTNAATFKGLAAGECLFLGAAGTKRGDEEWAVTFRFACSPNVTGLTLGSGSGEIPGIDKNGWDYLWVRYADFVDDTALQLVKRPVAVYIEKVYESGDFSTLGIGT